jgi:Ni,Fe-hydrogenase I cytochrome b subunit
LSETSENPPARRFNAGQKLVFWGVVLGGILLTLTGIMLMFPFYVSGYTGMQVAQIIHATVALLMIGLIIGHIYIGTIGMQGAFQAMWSGQVDRNWAKEHHSLWYRQMEKGAPGGTAEVPARRAPVAGSATGSFAAGIVIAILLALVMGRVYSGGSVGTNERSATAGVHLDAGERGAGTGR